VADNLKPELTGQGWHVDLALILVSGDEVNGIPGAGAYQIAARTACHAGSRARRSAGAGSAGLTKDRKCYENDGSNELPDELSDAHMDLRLDLISRLSG
jgi:hypothetical protein